MESKDPLPERQSFAFAPPKARTTSSVGHWIQLFLLRAGWSAAGNSNEDAQLLQHVRGLLLSDPACLLSTTGPDPRPRQGRSDPTVQRLARKRGDARRWYLDSSTCDTILTAEPTDFAAQLVSLRHRDELRRRHPVRL